MKRLALIGLALIAARPAHAQIRGSVIGGFVSAKVAESFEGATVTLASRSGFVAGIGMSRDVAKDITFDAELLYVQKGFDQTSGLDEIKLKLGYIEVPLLFRAMFAGGSARPFITAGPALGFKVSCSAEASSGGNGVSQDCSSSDNGGVKSFDFGVMLGAGVTVRNVTISARYDVGLANIEPNPGPGESVKNRALMLLVSLAIK